MSSSLPTFLMAIVFSVLFLFLGLLLGSETLAYQDVLNSVFYPDLSSVSTDILFSIRLPRTFSAYATGALLAFSGCLMQTLFQNPLADSYLLGTSSGASLGMLVGVMAGIASHFLPLIAALGAFISVLSVLLLGKWLIPAFSDRSHTANLLLTGVMMTAMINAVMLLMLTLLPDHALRGMLFWIIGDLSYPDYWPIAAITVIACLLFSLFLGKTWNIVAYGALQAKALGVSIRPVFLITLLLIGTASGVSVSVAGPIGFIGLVSPHVLRKIIGHDLRFLVPLSMAFGGCLLVSADILARTIYPPIQPPVGIFTILLGAPTFLLLMLYQKKYR